MPLCSSYGTYMLSAARCEASTSAGASPVLCTSAVYTSGVCAQGRDRLSGVAQVLARHHIGVGVVVHHRLVFIGPGDAIDAEFSPLPVGVEAQVQPEARRFHEHLGTVVLQELLVARRVQ